MAKVLVVDDSAFLVNEVRKNLELNGHEVVATGKDGNEGVQLFKEHRPDLTLMDITMPNMDGRDCLTEILKADAKAKIVIVSAVKDAEVIMECLKAGARGYIEKPLKFRDHEFCEEFKSTIEKAIEE